MKITWVTRSFLDYRIPVYRELDRLCGGKLTVIYNREVVSAGVIHKIESILGDKAVGMTGELRLGGKKIDNASMANTSIRIPFQPGLIKKITQTRPEIMLSDGFMQWTYAPLWLRAVAGIKHVMCYERTGFTERNCQLYRKLYRKLALRAIDAVCVNGSLCAEYVQSLGVKPEQIFSGQMSADTDGMAEAAAMVPQEQARQWRRDHAIKPIMLLYVGQVIPRKGLKQLLQAWQKLDPDSPCSLVIVGDGSELAPLQEWTRANNLNEVHWLGRQPYDSIAAFYRAADVFIIPTLQDNWSLVVPEAMACGLPVACSKYNGCHPELVHPQNGWVFDPLDEADTVKVLQQIIAAQTQLPAMGEASRQIVAEFTPQHAAESIFNACQYALNHKR